MSEWVAGGGEYKYVVIITSSPASHKIKLPHCVLLINLHSAADCTFGCNVTLIHVIHWQVNSCLCPVSQFVGGSSLFNI